MVYFTLGFIVFINFISLLGIISYYNKIEPTFINEIAVSWLLFFIASGMLLGLVPTVIQNQYDKQIIIEDSVTVKELYDKGYVVIQQTDENKNIYNVREIVPYTQPLEEIKCSQ